MSPSRVVNMVVLRYAAAMIQVECTLHGSEQPASVPPALPLLNWQIDAASRATCVGLVAGIEYNGWKYCGEGQWKKSSEVKCAISKFSRRVARSRGHVTGKSALHPVSVPPSRAHINPVHVAKTFPLSGKACKAREMLRNDMANKCSPSVPEANTPHTGPLN